MINQTEFTQIKNNYPFIQYLPEKVQGMLQQELLPEEKIENIYEVTISNQPSCLVVSDRRLLGVWVMKMLFILKFPAMQEFNLSQINKIEKKSANTVFIHASVEADKPEDDYEENSFIFSDPSQVDAFIAQVTEKAERV